MIGAFAIAKNATCKIKINQKCVKGSCELINGVLFEKLTVLQKDSIGMPSEYIVTQRFKCYNPGVEGVQKFWPDKIYFNKINGHYKWVIDTVNIHFKTNKLGEKSVVGETPLLNYNLIFNSIKYDTCPAKLTENTWYIVKINDARLSNIFLFIDKNSIYHVYKFDSGICPI